MDLQTPSDEALRQAYLILGTSFDERTTLLQEANIALRLAFHAERMPGLTDTDLDTAVMQLAHSPYAKHTCRMPLVSEAAKGGAFSDNVMRVVLNTAALRKNLQHIDICNGADILMEVAKTFGAQRHPGYELIAQLACVSVLCARMKGFDPEAKLRRMFGKAGQDFAQFAAVIDTYGLRNDLLTWLNKQSNPHSQP